MAEQTKILYTTWVKMKIKELKTLLFIRKKITAKEKLGYCSFYVIRYEKKLYPMVALIVKIE